MRNERCDVMEHYYSEKPTSKSTPHTYKITIRGFDLTFMTDAGVFSKHTLDFGTKLLIETFEFPKVQGPLLDIGCGYGPIGLALAKQVPGRRVVMVDVNERAVALAEKNRQANNIQNAIVIQSNLFEKVRDERYAAILSNPPIRAGKKVVYELFRHAHDYLMFEGELWIVIQKKQGAPSAKKELLSLFGNVEVMNKQKGYFIFRSVKQR